MVSNQISAEGEIRPKASLFRGQRGRGRDMIWNTLCIRDYRQHQKNFNHIKVNGDQRDGNKKEPGGKKWKKRRTRGCLQRKRDWNAWGKYKQAVFSLSSSFLSLPLPLFLFFSQYVFLTHEWTMVMGKVFQQYVTPRISQMRCGAFPAPATICQEKSAGKLAVQLPSFQGQWQRYPPQRSEFLSVILFLSGAS